MNDKIDIIVAGVNRKDKKMWGDFYDRFYTALCVYVSKILPVPDAVEDLVQEVFISVWEGKRTFSDIKELTNYLYRACYNNALLYIRNNQIHDTILSSLAEEESMVDDLCTDSKRRNYPATLLLYRRTSCRTTSDYFNEN